MMSNFQRICVKDSTKKLFMSCRKEFLKHHPEFKTMEDSITEDRLTIIVCEYYLRTP